MDIEKWDSRLEEFEYRYGALIIMIGVAFMIFIMFMLGWIVMSAEGYNLPPSHQLAIICNQNPLSPVCEQTIWAVNQTCLEMMLGDEWDKGYVLDIARECLTK